MRGEDVENMSIKDLYSRSWLNGTRIIVIPVNPNIKKRCLLF